jgi:hypothetical protein
MMTKLATIGVCAIILVGGIAASASAGGKSGGGAGSHAGHTGSSGGHPGSKPGHGPPAGYQEPHYGAAAAFSNHTNEAQTQFLGPNTVLGKMFRYNWE